MTVIVVDIANKVIMSDSRRTQSEVCRTLLYEDSIHRFNDQYYSKIIPSRTMDHVTYAIAGTVNDCEVMVGWLEGLVSNNVKNNYTVFNKYSTVLQFCDYPDGEQYVNEWINFRLVRRYKSNDVSYLVRGSGTRYACDLANAIKTVTPPVHIQTVLVQYAINKDEYCGGSVIEYRVSDRAFMTPLNSVSVDTKKALMETVSELPKSPESKKRKYNGIILFFGVLAVLDIAAMIAVLLLT